MFLFLCVGEYSRAELVNALGSDTMLVKKPLNSQVLAL